MEKGSVLYEVGGSRCEVGAAITALGGNRSGRRTNAQSFSEYVIGTKI